MGVIFILTVLISIFLAYRLVTITKKLENCIDNSLEEEEIHFSEILKLKEEISKKESLIKSVQATNKRLLIEIEDYKVKLEGHSMARAYEKDSPKEEVVKPKRKYTKKKN